MFKRAEKGIVINLNGSNLACRLIEYFIYFVKKATVKLQLESPLISVPKIFYFFLEQPGYFAYLNKIAIKQYHRLF